MRLKYRNQISTIWQNYYQTRSIFESIQKQNDEDSEFFVKVKQKEYHEMTKVFPTINLIRNLTSPSWLRTKHIDYDISKDEMIFAFNEVKKLIEVKINNVSNLFNVDSTTRAKSTDSPQRKVQIKSVKSIIKDYHTQLDAIQWYEDLIKTSPEYIEEKINKMKVEENAKLKTSV